MPQEKMMTFEEVNEHLDKHPLATTKGAAAAAPKICDVYKTVKPVLVLLSQAFFIPEKWRTPVKALIAALDAICPGT